MADDFLNRARFGGSNISTVPYTQYPAMDDPRSGGIANTGPTSTPMDDTISKAAQGAKTQAGISDQVIQDILKSAIPGIPEGSIQNRPQVMLPTPIRPKQLPMSQPTGNVAATTRAGQRRNDFNQMFASVGNLVKGGINKKREAEDRDLMADLAIIQAASANPSDPHNQAILDAIAKDPKKIKRLQKAIGYNPLSGEPPPPEAQTMIKFGAEQQKKQQAADVQAKIAQATGSPAMASGNNPNAGGGAGAAIGQGEGAYPGAMGNLMNRMPNTPQVSPMVQIQAELIKAGILPKADTSLRAMTDLIKEAMTSDTKLKEIEQKAQASNNRTLLGLANSIRAAQVHLETERMKQKGATEREGMRGSAQRDVATIRGQSAYERYKARYGDEKAKNLDKLIKDVDSDIKNLDVQIAAEKDKTKQQSLKDQQAAKKAQKDSLENLMQFRDADAPESPVDKLRGTTPSTKEMDDIDQDGGGDDDGNMNMLFR